MGYLSLPTDVCTRCQCQRWKHRPSKTRHGNNGSCTRCGPAKCVQFVRGKGKYKKRQRAEAA